MKTKAFRQINAADRDVSLIQGNVANKFAEIDLNPMVGGNLLTAVAITNGVSGTQIPHGLTITPSGWVVVDKLDFGDVYRISWSSKFITLRSSVASLTISLWVY
jgi:hypothetical protein